MKKIVIPFCIAFAVTAVVCDAILRFGFKENSVDAMRSSIAAGLGAAIAMLLHAYYNERKKAKSE